MNDLAPAHEPTALAEALAHARAQLRLALPEQEAGGELLCAFSERILALVTPTVAQATLAADRQFGRLAVLATGGLARRELCPFSDLDLIVLVDATLGEGDEAFAGWIRGLTHPLWAAGLRVRTIVHTRESWLAGAIEDLTLCTALLDMRFIAGDGDRVDELAAEAHQRFFGDQRAMFLQRLADDAGARQARYGTTVYRVEPDLKFGPGGTRDMATVEWALLARHAYPEPWDPRRAVSAFRSAGAPRRVADMLAHGRDVILRMRAALHLVAGRTQDRLNFHYQEGMPALLGLLDADQREALAAGRLPDEQLVAAIEACMQTYYRGARELLRYGRRVFSRCLPPRAIALLDHRIDERFHAIEGRLHHYGKDPFVDKPVLGLEALTIARDRQLDLAGETIDAIVDATAAIPEGDARLADDPEAQQRFLDLLVDPVDAGSPTPLGRVFEVGLIERLVPEFAASRGRMQHEGFHVYTVDQHSLYAVEFLKAIARGEHRRDYTMASAIHLAIDDPRVLYLATLLHDSGKPYGDQCEEGAKIAGLAARRAGLGEAAAKRCAFLVEHHQTMPILSQKRDLTDPLLIREFAETVRDRGTLDELYLVGLADMANVSPDYLTSWKLTLLDELYLRTAAEFATRGRRANTARRARLDEPEGLPERYYSLFDQALRRQHRTLIDALRGGDKPVVLDVAEGAGALRVTVVTHDRRGLLASLTGAFADFGLEVVAADVFSAPFAPRIVLDVFRVVHKTHGPAHDSAWVASLEDHLRERIAGTPVGDALREPLPAMPGPTRKSKRRKSPTKVRFSEDPAGNRTIVDVETVENAGVAARISRSFAALGHDIEIARINTELRRVEAVIYVSKLDEAQREELEQMIRANLRTRRG
ncbi:HD domain-containing protein [Nannocystaceae bacterium ST9]